MVGRLHSAPSTRSRHAARLEQQSLSRLPSQRVPIEILTIPEFSPNSYTSLYHVVTFAKQIFVCHKK